MNKEIYNKVFQRIKQIDSLKCGYQIMEFEIFDEHTKYSFCKEKKILHSFKVQKKDNGESGPFTGFVYFRHDMHLCDRPLGNKPMRDPYEYINIRMLVEEYEYIRGEEYLSAAAIEFGGEICRNIKVEEYEALQQFMLFDNHSLIDFDEFFRILDLKIIALV